MRTMACAASIAIAAFVAPTASYAGVFGDDLSKCLAVQASPTDKAKFVRWMFSAMSLNPAVAPMAKIAPAERDAYNREMIGTFERLIMKDCRKEFVAALKHEGETAVIASFEFFGRSAAIELFSDPATTAEMQKLNGASDEAEWDKLYAEAGRTRAKPAQ